VDLRIDVWKRAKASAKTLAANQALAAKRQGSKGDRMDKQTRKLTQIKQRPPAIRFWDSLSWDMQDLGKAATTTHGDNRYLLTTMSEFTSYVEL
jgi:hypothetical protein